MTNLKQLLGILWIAIALIVAPFSMVHASIGLHSHDEHQSHAVTHDDHMVMNHDDNHRPNKDRNNQADGSEHEGHDNASCCSSTCGGALVMEFDNLGCPTLSRQPMIIAVNSLEPGEWVPPFRPPST